MDTQLKRKWIAALRSGDFKRGTGRFKDGDLYCCLGVLCVVAGKSTNSHTSLPNLLIDNWNFARETLGKNAEGHAWSQILSGINDCDGSTFTQIADYIERNL